MKVYDLSTTVSNRVEKAFQQNPLSSDQVQRIDKINERFMQIARGIATMTPECPEQTRVINMLQEANLLCAEAIKKNE